MWPHRHLRRRRVLLVRQHDEVIVVVDEKEDSLGVANPLQQVLEALTPFRVR
jgi:hypothetical protein